MSPEAVRSAFEARFGAAPAVVARAPGRVNLIGEHTDYNDGYVLPIATPHATFVAAAPRDDDTLRVFSAELNEECTWPVGRWRAAPRPHWTSYVAGVAERFQPRSAALRGADLLTHSEVPLGAGLSSSAALTLAAALALARLAEVSLPRSDLAALARAAENHYAGVPCGVMDQYASIFCAANAALLLDCRSLTHQLVPLELPDHTFCVIDSGVKHDLAAGEYARRQEECRAAVEFFSSREPSVSALRDLDEAQVARTAEHLPPNVSARARHVTSENQRVLQAVTALRAGNLPTFGRLMNESHESLRHDYEVSCTELDLLVDIARQVPGVCGARMTGGGFGGSVVVLARADAVEPLTEAVHRRYDQAERQARLFAVRPGPGAAVVYP